MTPRINFIEQGDPVPVVGGPADGHKHPFHWSGSLRLTSVMPITHHWYRMRTTAAMDMNGERQYRDEWHYVGVGDLRGPFQEARQ